MNAASTRSDASVGVSSRLGVLLALGGCAVGPSFKKPEVDRQPELARGR